MASRPRPSSAYFPDTAAPNIRGSARSRSPKPGAPGRLPATTARHSALNAAIRWGR